jgi:hypothetical protein
MICHKDLSSAGRHRARRIRALSGVLIAAAALTFAASSAGAATAPRTMELQILANGRLLLSGELIDNVDDLEARLRVLREQGEPLELRLRVPKSFGFDILLPITELVQRMGMSFGFIRDDEPRPPARLGAQGDAI